MAIFSRLVKAYKFCHNVYSKRLFVSNTVSTMVLLGLGDLLTQSIEHKISNKSRKNEIKQSDIKSTSDSSQGTNNFDLARTAKVTCVGITTGPFGHYWYSFLDKKFAARTALNIMKKVFCDQLIAAPIFNILFIFALHTIDGKHIKQVYEIFKEKFLLIYTYDCCIWPAIQIFNFYFISATYRLLYVNTASLIWNSILSYVMFQEAN